MSSHLPAEDHLWLKCSICGISLRTAAQSRAFSANGIKFWGVVYWCRLLYSSELVFSSEDEEEGSSNMTSVTWKTFQIWPFPCPTEKGLFGFVIIVTVIILLRLQGQRLLRESMSFHTSNLIRTLKYTYHPSTFSGRFFNIFYTNTSKYFDQAFRPCFYIAILFLGFPLMSKQHTHACTHTRTHAHLKTHLYMQ